jgi:hypothetical protein
MKTLSLKRLQSLALILVTMVAGLITSGSVNQQIPPVTVYVPATAEWTFTGLNVQAGQVLLLNARGYACTSSEYGIGSTSDPGGQIEGLGCGLYEDAPPPCALDYAPYGMLVGKIISTKGEVAFAIGNADSVKMPASGRLFLSINDNLGTYGDNLGYYLVTIR